MRAIDELANLQRFFSTHPLTRDSPLRAWGRFTWWQFRSRMQDEILFRWIGGQRLAIQRGMVGATGNVYVGLHEFPDMMFPLHFLRGGDLFLDVGANVGTYTVLASGVCRAKTCAFEPDPGAVRRLERNITINGLEALAKVYEFALGPKRGGVAFTVGHDAGNRIADADETNIRTVLLERLDTVVAGLEPIMIKVDVEGAEEGVLQGATELLAKPCLRVVELETVTLESARILGRNEFERAYYDPFCRSLNREPIDLNSSNSLFIRDWSFVSARLAAAKEVEILGRRI